MDFVIVAPQRWDFEIGSNARNIAMEIAKKNRVIYVNPPDDWITYLRKVRESKTIFREKKKDSIVKAFHNLWVLQPQQSAFSINWIKSAKVYDILNRENNKQIARSISEALQVLEFKDIVILNDNSMFKGLYLKEFLRPFKYLYYIRDFLTIQPYFKKHGVRLEPEIMKKSDAVIANSTYLKEYGEQFNKKSFYVGQGCETEMFSPEIAYDIPHDIQGISHPIIGYVGFLTSMRLDIQLLEAIAKSNSEWNLVLVGPEDEQFKNSALHQLKNVHFLGRKQPAELPAYVNAFDVCINPQLVNELTIGNYPRKVDEYLAMGKPTVATRTKAMEIFSEHSFLASGNEEFIRQIKIALNDKDKDAIAKRITFARSHTWDNSVEKIYEVINHLSTTAE